MAVNVASEVALEDKLEEVAAPASPHEYMIVEGAARSSASSASSDAGCAAEAAGEPELPPDADLSEGAVDGYDRAASPEPEAEGPPRDISPHPASAAGADPSSGSPKPRSRKSNST